MCMRKVTWVAKNPTKNPKVPKWTKGYKVFKVGYERFGDNGWEKDENYFHFPYYSIVGQQAQESLEFNKVYKASDAMLTKGVIRSSEKTEKHPEGVPYPAGFHIFPIKMAMYLYQVATFNKQHVCFEVEYRKVVAIGEHTIHTTYPADMVIAREMRILRKLTDEEVTALKQIEAGNYKIRRR